MVEDLGFRVHSRYIAYTSYEGPKVVISQTLGALSGKLLPK